MDIVAAERRIRSHITQTPLLHSPWLSALSGGEVLLKMESHQPTGAFKLRGAAHKLSLLTPAQARAGVVTASSGNHALGVAAMGKALSVPVEVFVADDIASARLQRIRAHGVAVRTVPGGCLGAETAARAEAQASGRVYVSPYNDLDVVAGQGSIAVELLRQAPALDAVFVAVGGGGLVAGIGAGLRAQSPHTQVVGCWPEHSPVMDECLRAGRIFDVPELPTLSTATAGGLEADAVTFELCRQLIGRSVRVSEDAILQALRQLWREQGELAEGAAGVAIAAFQQVAADYAGQRVAIIVCGGNADEALATRIRA